MLNMIGQCGPILGTRVYPSSDEPRFQKGHSVCAGFMGFTTLLAITLRFLLVLENKKLDRTYGTLKEQKTRRAQEIGGKHLEVEAGENYGESYRYVL